MLLDLAQPRELTRAVEWILRDDVERSKLADAGLKHAEARSWDAVATDTMNVYRKVADALGPPYLFSPRPDGQSPAPQSSAGFGDRAP